MSLKDRCFWNFSNDLFEVVFVDILDTTKFSLTSISKKHQI